VCQWENVQTPQLSALRCSFHEEITRARRYRSLLSADVTTHAGLIDVLSFNYGLWRYYRGYDYNLFPDV
jgi:hypothetical protein